METKSKKDIYVECYYLKGWVFLLDLVYFALFGKGLALLSASGGVEEDESQNYSFCDIL